LIEIQKSFSSNLLVIRTRETATIIYKQLKLMKKINIEYFSIDTDFREHNLLLSFLVEGNLHQSSIFIIKESQLNEIVPS
jgi:hypothetical protein